MADNPAQTTPSLPALVVVGNLGYMVWLAEASHGNKLGEVVFFIFLVAPGSVLFLAVYAAVIGWLRRSPRQRGAPVMVALASLAGLLACALGFGLLAVVFMVEAALG
jgi:hypothetical protein